MRLKYILFVMFFSFSVSVAYAQNKVVVIPLNTAKKYNNVIVVANRIPNASAIAIGIINAAWKLVSINRVSITIGQDQTVLFPTMPKSQGEAGFKD